MTLPAFIIICVIAIAAATIFIELAALPGTLARKRGHPQAEAINVLGWVGLIAGIAPWIVALVWAFTRPGVLDGAERGREDDPS